MTQGMTARTRRAMLALSLALVFGAWGCGRDALERTCTSEADCRGDRVCFQGQCYDEDLTPPTDSDDGMPPVDPDSRPDTPDGNMGEPDSDVPPPPDMPPPVDCVDDSDCPGGGGLVPEGDQCVSYSCSRSNTCEPQSMAIDCGPGFQLVDCECVPAVCESIEDCANDLGCVRGRCEPCRQNDDCGPLVCGEDGRCTECVEDLDCSARELCEDNVCVGRPECVIDTDCDEQEVCLNGRCAYSPECTNDDDCAEGYECIGDRCFEAICRGPEDCEQGQLCDGGVCVDQPPPSSVDRCFVATPSVTVAPGQTVRLEAFAVDAMGNGIAANFVWMSDNPPVASVAGTRATAGPTAGTARITAALAGGDPIMCDGEVTLENVGPPPMPGAGRVVVLDAETGAPVSGAEVVINQNAPIQTAANGVARFGIPAGPYQVSVFSDAHDYVTIQEVTSSDIRVPLLERSGDGPVAGFKGEFNLSQISSMGDFNLGLAGASIPGGLINFDLTSLLGEPFQTEFTIPGQGNVEFPLPGGLVLYGRVFGLRINLKDLYYATSSGGARLAWGLAGSVPSSELISIFQGGGFDDIGDALTVLLPLFNRFDHGVKPLNLTARPRVADFGDIDGDGDAMELVPDYGAFPDVSLSPNVRQQLVTSIGVSNLPTLTDGPAEVSIIVGGTQLDSSGFVPLGISATNDDDGDGRPDVRRLTMAPPYSSLVGGRYAVLSIAFRTDAVGAGQQGVEFPDEFSVALWNGQTLPTSIQLGTFPSTASVIESPPQRSLTISSPAGPLYRARFVGTDRSWDVWSPGPAGVMGQFNHTVVVPDVPAGRVDLFTTADKVLLDSIRSQIKIDDLLKPSGIPLYDAALVSTGFSRTLVR